jgi:hypothetical protein
MKVDQKGCESEGEWGKGERGYLDQSGLSMAMKGKGKGPMVNY